MTLNSHASSIAGGPGHQPASPAFYAQDVDGTVAAATDAWAFESTGPIPDVNRRQGQEKDWDLCPESFNPSSNAVRDGKVAEKRAYVKG